MRGSLTSKMCGVACPCTRAAAAWQARFSTLGDRGAVSPGWGRQVVQSMETRIACKSTGLGAPLSASHARDSHCEVPPRRGAEQHPVACRARFGGAKAVCLAAPLGRGTGRKPFVLEFSFLCWAPKSFRAHEPRGSCAAGAGAPWKMRSRPASWRLALRPPEAAIRPQGPAAVAA